MALMIGTVSKLVGKVFARAEDGSLRELRLGDQVFEGETVVTAEGAVVEIVSPEAPPIVVSGDRDLLLTGELAVATRATAEEAALAGDTIDAVVAALEGEGDLLEGLEETAASGAAGDEGSSFIRLGRIGFDLEATGEDAITAAIAGSTLDTSKADNDLQLLDNEDPDAVDDALTSEINQPITVSVLDNDVDPDGSLNPASITIVSGPADGEVSVNADGTVTYTPFTDYVGSDSFSYTVSDTEGAVSNVATVALSVRDFGELSVAGTEVIEGNVATATITRSGDALDEAQVTITTVVPAASDTAESDDFVAGSQVLTFAPGVTSLTFTVNTNDDALLESAETFRVELTDPTGGAVVSTTNGEGTITILDNDTANVVISDAQTEEGSSATFSVTLTQASESSVDWRFAVSVEPGDTAEPDDFDASTLLVSYDDGSGSISITANSDGTYTVPAGVTDIQVSVPTTDDDVFEGDETFTLSASVAAGAIDTSDTGTGTISDDGSQPDSNDENNVPDDDRPAFSIDDVSVSEDEGTITFTVELTGDTELGASVQYVVGEDTALEPEDYSGDDTPDSGIDGLTGVLTFAPGVAQQTITLAVSDDALNEGSEQFTVTLADAVNATIEDGEGVGTISDEAAPDPTYTLQLFAVVDGDYVDANTIAEDGGVGTYVVLAVDGAGQPLTPSEQPGGTVTVNVGDAADTADRVDDYTSQATVTATIGVVFTIAAIDDVYADSGETFSLSLAEDWSEAGNWEAVSYAAAPVVTTLFDDSDTSTLTLDTLDADEGTDDATVSATLSAAPVDEPVVVTLENGATITFDIGETTANSTPFAVQGDDVYQDGENFQLDATLTSGGGQFEDLVVDGEVTVNVTDTETPVTVNLSASDVDEGGSVTIVATLDADLPAEARDEDITLFLSNGGLLVIPQGENTGRVTLSVSDLDDAYINGDRDYEISATGFRGGSEFELFQPGTPATFSVRDNGTVTTVTLSTDDVTAEDAGVTFTATLDNPAQGQATVTTDLGDIVIADGESTGTLFVSTQGSDVYSSATSITATVEDVTGGNFEAVDFSDASATAQITDGGTGTPEPPLETPIEPSSNGVEEEGSAKTSPTTGGRTLMGAQDTDGVADNPPAAMSIEVTEAVVPIAIDMDGDSVSYLLRDAGALFTDQASGESVNPAWVDPEDGMLVFGANTSGTVDESREYVSNEWSEPNISAGGDVVVRGQSSLTWSDGEVTVAKDASFAIEAADVIGGDEGLILPAGQTASGVGAASVALADNAEPGVKGIATGADAVAMLELDILLINNVTKLDTESPE